ncbi:MAG TPA: acyl-CoA dehydrogenase [Candidatus Kapabacteria bacterium]|nr:acyl-CoA dehydrogenase [Candidatus Kapabacteria bacterium]
MDIFLTEDHRKLFKRVLALGKAMPKGDHESDSYAVDLVRWLAKNNLLAPLIGKGRISSRALCVTRHALAYHSSLADSMFAMQGLGSYPIALAGNAKQKKILNEVVAGKRVAAFALTEPDAGSDIVSMQTTAKRDKKFYIVNGRKTFISNAGIADHYILFAKTSPELGKKGVSAFILEANTPGLKIERQEVVSPHPIGELVMKNCRIPAENLLGSEGGGLRIALATLEVFRPTVGAAALGFAERALDETLSYTNTRKQFGQRLNEFQGTQFRLADMAAQLAAAKSLVYTAAHQIDTQGEEITLASSIGKMYATEAAQTIIDSAVQLHGGRGVLKDSITERLYRDIRSLRIYEGTTEIQKLVIARELIKKQNA